MRANNYPQYAAIQGHIDRANIGRAVVVAETLAEAIVYCWKAIQAPPPPATVIINDRCYWMGQAAAHH